MTTRDTVETKGSGALGAVGRLWAEVKENRRAATGLLAIGVLLGSYGILGLNDAVLAMRSLYSQEALRLQRDAAIGQEKDWPARARASTVMRQALAARLWQAESEGVALANVQDWVTTAAREAGIDRLQVKLDLTKPEALPPDMRQLTATISARQTEATLEAFLGRIERDPHLLIVDRLHVQERPFPALDLTLITYVKLTTPAKAAAHE